MFFKKKPQAVATADQSITEDGSQQPKQDLEKAPTNTGDTLNYPKGMTLVLSIISVFVCVFLVSLDRMIVATAIPAITDEFGSVTDIGWYASAFMLTTCAFQLLFGKLYTAFSMKYVWLASVLVFEIGSAISGAAPSSVALIVGRAIAGVGGAGTLSGAVMVIAWCFPLHKRAMYQGLLGAVIGVSSVAGPLLGGLFTSEVSWRWCFYINLPIGAVAVFFLVFLLDIEDCQMAKGPLKERLAQLDFYGTALIVLGSICLILALQWGGSRYQWSDGHVIALLIMSCALLGSFVLVQVFLPKTATLPPHIFIQRSIWAGALSSFCNGAQLIIFMYYLPIWFQAIQGYTAVESGIQSLATLLSMVGASIVSGILVRKVGYYTPGLIVGVCFSSIGAGLLTTLEADTSKAKWVGYQILLGFGMGFTNLPPKLAAQTILPQHEIPIGTSVMFFFQFLGGAIFASVGQNVLNSQLAKHLSNLPGFDAATLQSSGATFIANLAPSIKSKVIIGYNKSLQTVFLVGLVVTCSSILGALGMEWKSMNEAPQEPASAAEESKRNSRH